MFRRAIFRIPQLILSTALMYPAMLVAIPLSWPAAYLLADKNGYLPKWLHWMETWDNLGWIGPLSEGRTRAVFYAKGPKPALAQWLRRNKAYGLRMGILGMPSGNRPTVYRYGMNVHDWKETGLFWRFLINRRGYFQLQFGASLLGRGLYMNIGWKLANSGLTHGMLAGITPRQKDLT